MYLVTIARLRPDGRTLLLSRLTDALSISLVSVNEMCHKLQDQDLVSYRPYKGVTLSPEGERRAYRTLRRHRLWEVFLVDNLGLGYDQPHTVSCAFEHTTPDLLAERLDAFLNHPVVNPRGQPIPRADNASVERVLTP